MVHCNTPGCHATNNVARATVRLVPVYPQAIQWPAAVRDEPPCSPEPGWHETLPAVEGPGAG